MPEAHLTHRVRLLPGRGRTSRLTVVGRALVSRAATTGFTLIETLLAISVIAVLVALIVPTLSKGAASARQTRQGTAIAQAAAMLHAYAIDWKDTFPVAPYQGSVEASHKFYEPLVVGGYYSDLASVDPDAVRKSGRPNMAMSECLVYDPERMTPGRTEPEASRHSRKVRVAEVLSPSAKGAVGVVVVNDGRIEANWCCINGAPRGAVAFCDGSVASAYWRELIPSGSHYHENGIGMPVWTTWLGCRGRDRQR